MRWFGAASLWLQHVGDGSRSNLLKLIALLLSVPCFEGNNLCFKIAYAINLRRMRLAGIDCAGLSFHDDAAKFNNLSLKNSRVANTYHRLRQIKGRLEACDCGADFTYGHDSELPSLAARLYRNEGERP